MLVEDRYTGATVARQTPGDLAAASEALSRSAQTYRHAAAEHEPDPDERIRAAAQAEQHEAAGDHAREDGRAMYDTAERRDATARDLEGKGLDHELIATRMRADVSQAQPATGATAASAQKANAPRARRGRGRPAQAQRAGLDR
ncbi:hypothetical protein [Isoptericola croceus]|uniref:hypothetical protein n=1 Tax=Isoptericola croceus TaxID=3031406 RepID=UPI0023F62DE2|nr:hypothetical protein [Isoptericola croceus]